MCETHFMKVQFETDASTHFSPFLWSKRRKTRMLSTNIRVEMNFCRKIMLRSWYKLFYLCFWLGFWSDQNEIEWTAMEWAGLIRTNKRTSLNMSHLDTKTVNWVEKLMKNCFQAKFRFCNAAIDANIDLQTSGLCVQKIKFRENCFSFN